MAYSFLIMAEDILKETKKPMTIDEMWNYAEEKGLAQKLGTAGKTPWKTLSARMYVDMKENRKTKFQKVSKSPTKFGLVALSYQEVKQGMDEKDEKEKQTFKERDLHVLLNQFVRSEQHFLCYTKTIYHEKSRKRKGGKNKWLHPDIVGVYFPYEEYDKDVIELMDLFRENKCKIFSFEMKKRLNFDNLREYYFQAVSNSSWANEGYLVVLEMEKSEELLSEIRRLNNAFGIGLIQLNAQNIEQSEIVFPSKIEEQLDWDTINRLQEENEDFKDFIQSIMKDIKALEPRGNYDKIYSEKELEQYLHEKGFVF